MIHNQPRRSPRIAAKNAQVLPAAAQKAITTLKTLMESLDGIYDKNKRAEIICNVFEYLINDPFVLAAYPNFRQITITRAYDAVQAAFQHKTIHSEAKEALVHTATEILRIISTIETHPAYVA